MTQHIIFTKYCYKKKNKNNKVLTNIFCGFKTGIYSLNIEKMFLKILRNFIRLTKI